MSKDRTSTLKSLADLPANVARPSFATRCHLPIAGVRQPVSQISFFMFSRYE